VRAAAPGVAVIRELAENPNVHQPLSPGRELLTDARGRYAIYLGAGTGVHSATVQRVRLSPDEVESAVAEIRAILHERGRAGSEWELGESSTPADVVERLLALGIVRDEDPVAIGMVLHADKALPEPPGTTARRVESVDELVLAKRIQNEAFGGGADEVGQQQAESDFTREGVDGSTFLGFVDGEPVAAGYASYTPLGLILFGGATLPPARGRGAYRALVAARAREAAARGTPVVVTHAGRMSRPILERLGFEPYARIDRLLDVLPA
jgi:GNAT superfamily N-acetyltransferase